MSQEHKDKWKEIVRKLSFHSELRVIWNQLKLRGGFLTNEHFIKHLLHHEAKRQCVQYAILCEKESVSSSELTQPCSCSDENKSCPCQQRKNASLTASTYRDTRVGENSLNKGDSNKYNSAETQLQKETPAPVSPPLQNLFNETDTVELVLDENCEAQIQLYELPDNCKEQCVFTVLESQIQCSTDEPGIYTSMMSFICCPGNVGSCTAMGDSFMPS